MPAIGFTYNHGQKKDILSPIHEDYEPTYVSLSRKKTTNLITLWDLKNGARPSCQIF